MTLSPSAQALSEDPVTPEIVSQDPGSPGPVVAAPALAPPGVAAEPLTARAEATEPSAPPPTAVTWQARAQSVVKPRNDSFAQGADTIWRRNEDRFHFINWTKHAFANVDEIVKVPGIGFGEGGPGDMALSFGFKPGDPKAREVQAKIFAAAKAQKLYWLGIGEGARDGNIEEAIERSIKEGHMVGSGERTAQIGRRVTKRPMPY